MVSPLDWEDVIRNIQIDSCRCSAAVYQPTRPRRSGLQRVLWKCRLRRTGYGFSLFRLTASPDGDAAIPQAKLGFVDSLSVLAVMGTAFVNLVQEIAMDRPGVVAVY